MTVKPSILIRQLWGSAGHITLRRFRGRIVVTPRILNAPPELAPPPEPRVVILDNAAPGFSVVAGVWNLFQAPDHWATNYRANDPPFFFAEARFTFGINAEYLAALYEWHPTHPAAHPACPHSVDAVDGWHYPTVNQTINQGQWNLLGQYAFNPDHDTVIILNYSDNVPLADALKIVEVL